LELAVHSAPAPAPPPLHSTGTNYAAAAGANTFSSYQGTGLPVVHESQQQHLTSDTSPSSVPSEPYQQQQQFLQIQDSQQESVDTYKHQLQQGFLQHQRRPGWSRHKSTGDTAAMGSSDARHNYLPPGEY
jgi:hypothetical protein